MSRIAYVILFSCLIVFVGFVASTANAGGRDDGYYRDYVYYRDIDYRPRPAPRAWYSSTCCYRKIVRHVGRVRQVRYVKIKPPRIEKVRDEPHYYYGPAPRPRPRPLVSRDERGRHYAKYEVTIVQRDHGPKRDRCHHKRVRVLSGDGGWVWALTAKCY